MSKKVFWKNPKKLKKIEKKLSEIIRKIINDTCIYDILAIADQSWKRKKKERKKIEKYFKSSCLRELKILLPNLLIYIYIPSLCTLLIITVTL